MKQITKQMTKIPGGLLQDEMPNDHGLGSSTRASCFQSKSHFHEPRLHGLMCAFSSMTSHCDSATGVFWISATEFVWRIRLRISSRAALALTQAR